MRLLLHGPRRETLLHLGGALLHNRRCIILRLGDGLTCLCLGFELDVRRRFDDVAGFLCGFCFSCFCCILSLLADVRGLVLCLTQHIGCKRTHTLPFIGQCGFVAQCADLIMQAFVRRLSLFVFGLKGGKGCRVLRVDFALLVDCFIQVLVAQCADLIMQAFVRRLSLFVFGLKGGKGCRVLRVDFALLVDCFIQVLDCGLKCLDTCGFDGVVRLELVLGVHQTGQNGVPFLVSLGNRLQRIVAIGVMWQFVQGLDRVRVIGPAIIRWRQVLVRLVERFAGKPSPANSCHWRHVAVRSGP